MPDTTSPLNLTVTPTLSIAPGFADRPEGSGAPGMQFTFAVTRAGDSTIPVSVNYRITSTQAQPDDFLSNDFIPSDVFPSGTLTMAAGQTSKSIAIVVVSDNQPEADERFTITLLDPVAAVVGVASAEGIIRNDDNAPVSPVFRFAKISNGAYFFTGSRGERDLILANYPDFRPEGIGFNAYADSSVGAPVFRFANLLNGGYFYTGSVAERDATIANYPNMRYEGTTFSVAFGETPGAQPVYRLANLNNGAYLYTVSAAERDAAIRLGHWRNEGVSFYAPSDFGGADGSEGAVLEAADAFGTQLALAPTSEFAQPAETLWW